MDDNYLHYQMWNQQNNNKPNDLNRIAYGNAPQEQGKTTQKGGGGILGILKRNLNTVGQIGGGVGGGVAGGALAGTAVLPGVGTGVGALVGGLLGAFGGGVAGESAKRAALGEQQNLGESLKQGAIGAGNDLIGQGIGAVGGKVLGKLVGKGTEIAGESGARTLEQGAADVSKPGVLQNLFGGMRQDVVNPIVKASPTGAATEAKIASGVDELLPMGSASAKYKAMPGVMNDLGGQIDQAVAKNGTKINVTDLAKEITDKMGNAANYPAEEKTFVSAVNSHLNGIAARAGEDGTISVGDLVQARKAVADDAQGAFKKLASGNPLTTRDEAALGVWQHLSDTLNTTAPEVKDLVGKQSLLYQAAPGLEKQAKSTVGIPLLGIKSKTAARTIQAGKDIVGAGGEGAVNVARTLGSVINPITSRAIPKAVEASSAPQDVSQKFPDLNQDQPLNDSVAASGSSGDLLGSDNLKAMIQDALSSPDAKTQAAKLDLVSKLATIQSSLAKQDSTQLSSKQQDRHDALQTALSSLDAAEQNLVTSGGAKGLLGYGATVPVLGQFLDQPGAAYHNTKIELATQLAKAITGGSRPAQSVIDKYLHSLPDVNDRAGYAADKIKKIRSELQNQAQSFKFDDLLQ